MEDFFNEISAIVPPKYSATITLCLVLSQMLGRALHSIRNGGGLRSMLGSIWFGTNIPQPRPPADSQASPRAPLVSFLVLAIGAQLLAGCATDPRAKAFQSLDSIRIVVDRAEKVYGRQCALGKIPPADQAKIDSRILQFHAAYLFAVDAASADYATLASPDLTRLAESLVQLIYTFAPEPAP